MQLFAGATSALLDEVQSSDPARSFIRLGEKRRPQTLKVTVTGATIRVPVPPGPGHTLVVDVAPDHTASGYFVEDLLREAAQ